MNPEEYKTIREEMLLRFRWTFEIIFFSIVSTSAIISWLAVKRSEVVTSDNYFFMNPFVFILVGLGIIAYLFSFYEKTLENIYKQGGYLAVFHELDDPTLRWHLLSRFQNDILKEKEKTPVKTKKGRWGADGRNAARLLIILTLVNIFAPLVFLQENIIPITVFDLLLIFFIIVIIIIIIYICYLLMYTQIFMKKDMGKWFDVKSKLSEEQILTDNKKLEEKIKKEFLKGFVFNGRM